MFESNITNLKKEEIKDLKEFIVRGYGDKYILLDDVHLKWQFFDNPFWGKEDPAIKVFKDENQKIRGILGLIPYKYQVQDKELKAVFLCNLLVEDCFRCVGIGPALIQNVVDTGEYDIVFTTGFNYDIKYMYERMAGWKIMDNLERYVLILNSERVNNLFELKERLLIKDFDTSKLPNFSEIQVSEIENFDDQDFFNFWSKMKRYFNITISRSPEYLNWRYANHPKINYKILGAYKNNEMSGYLVARIEEKEEIKVIRIVDFVALQESREILLKNLILYAKVNEIDLIDFCCTGLKYDNVLRKTGFIKVNDTVFQKIPMLFNPINYKKTYINFTFWGNEEAKKFQGLQDINNWFITKGEGDKDRIN